MSDNAVRVPPGCFWLIRAASWIVHRGQRKVWRERRERQVWNWWAFLSEHGAATREQKAALVRFCWRSFADAFWQRFDREQFFPGIRVRAGSPAFLAGTLLAMLAVCAMLSGGFSETRGLFVPPPYRDAGRLVVLSNGTRMFGQRLGIPLATMTLWRGKSETVENLAAWSGRGARLDGETVLRPGAEVSPGFFEVLGVEPWMGRTIEAGDPEGAMVAHDVWRRCFRADPGAVGKRFLVNGREAVLRGVLPPGFRCFHDRIAVWTALDPTRTRQYYFPMIGRLRSGVRGEQAQAELREIASRLRVPWSGARVELAPLPDLMRQSFFLYRAGLTLAGILVLAAAGLQWIGFGKRGPRHWKVWAFFLAKTAMLAGTLALVWIEIAVRLPVARDPVAGAILAWTYLLLWAGLVWFSCRDQKRRCPECLHRLALPVTIGSWSSPLLDPVSTELVCRRGHGTLNLAATASSASEPEHWTALDSSWRDLFSDTKK